MRENENQILNCEAELSRNLKNAFMKVLNRIKFNNWCGGKKYSHNFNIISQIAVARERERAKSRSLFRCFRDNFDLENNLPHSEREAFYYWGNFNNLKHSF